MSSLELFLKSNKAERKNKFYAPTKSMCDKNGKPLEWEFRHVPTKEMTAIRDACMREVPTGKFNQYRTKIDSDLFSVKMIVKATVFPDLNNKELQDSYGVMCAEDLVKEMIDDSTEYNSLVEFVSGISEDEDINEKVKEAKN